MALNGDIKSAFAAAIAHQKAGRLEDAEAIYHLILKAQPDHPDALHLLGRAALDDGRPDDAVALIGRAVNANGTVAPYRFALASAYAALEDFDRAASHYEKALALSPDHPATHNNLAIALLELGRIEEGIAHLEQAIKADPDFADAYNNLGNALVQAGRIDEAGRSYQRAIEVRPDFTDAHDNLGKLLLENTRPTQAIPHFKRAAELVPDNPEIARRLRQARANLVAPWHFPMLNDSNRNDAYRRAIEKAVTKNSVVLDIGAGSGLLAMIAARAGAKSVTACEMVEPIAESAREIIARNGLAERITLLAKRSTDIRIGEDMPEKANLLVHEIFDFGVLGEHVVPVLEHARTNLAVPDVQILPSAATVVALPVESDALRKAGRVDRACDFDVSPFNELSLPGLIPMRVSRVDYRPLAETAEVFRFDFAGAPIRPQQTELPVIVGADGICHGVVIWMRIELSEEELLDTGPQTDGSHWIQGVQILDTPVRAKKGESLTLQASHDRLQITVDLHTGDGRVRNGP